MLESVATIEIQISKYSDAPFYEWLRFWAKDGLKPEALSLFSRRKVLLPTTTFHFFVAGYSALS